MRSEDIPAYLKSRIKRRHLTYAQVAEGTFMTENQICRIVNGYAILKVEDLEQLCDYFDISISIGDDAKPIIRRRG